NRIYAKSSIPFDTWTRPSVFVRDSIVPMPIHHVLFSPVLLGETFWSPEKDIWINAFQASFQISPRMNTDDVAGSVKRLQPFKETNMLARQFVKEGGIWERMFFQDHLHRILLERLTKYLSSFPGITFYGRE